MLTDNQCNILHMTNLNVMGSFSHWYHPFLKFLFLIFNSVSTPLYTVKSDPSNPFVYHGADPGTKVLPEQVKFLRLTTAQSNNLTYFLAALILKVQNHTTLNCVTSKGPMKFIEEKYFHNPHGLKIQPVVKHLDLLWAANVHSPGWCVVKEIS